MRIHTPVAVLTATIGAVLWPPTPALPALRWVPAMGAPTRTVEQPSMRHATRVTVRKRACRVRVIDAFDRSVFLYKIQENAALAIKTAGTGAIPVLPGNGLNTKVLEAKPSGSGGLPTFGRRFSLAADWSAGTRVSFWYYGRKSGHRIKLRLFSKSAPDPGPPGWTLAWGDEFNGPAGTPPDPSIWNHENGDGSANGIPGWGNHELEYYTESTDNAALDGAGHLAITARKTDAQSSLQCYYGRCRYTSARLLTKDRIEVVHGRIEARIRVPAGAGLWPAFWGLGTNIDKVGWPQSGEIDVMENVGRLPYRLFGTIHGPGYSGSNGFGGTYDGAQPLANDFHTYAVEWQPDRIAWFIDGVQYHVATPKDVAPHTWVYNHPFYLLLNLAVGGDFGGAVAPETTFPQSMLVDYVRVYSAADTSARFEASFADTFSGWRRVTLPLTSFVRSAAQPAGAPAGRLDPKHMWGYAFEAPPGGRKPILVAQLSLEGSAGGKKCSTRGEL